MRGRPNTTDYGWVPGKEGQAVPDAPLILIVEDDADIRTVLCTFLEQAGFRIAAANERSVGAEILQSTRPAAMIADIMLRGGDGHELLEIARSMNVPTLLISGEPQAIAEYCDHHSVPFLKKPFRLADLEREVEKLLRTRN